MTAAVWGDALFWLLAVVGVFLTGISKSGFAGGAGVVAVPLLALVVSPALAVTLMLPLLLVMDAQIITHHRRNLCPGELRALLPAALVGIALGSFLLTALPDAPLQLLLGAMSIGFALMQWRRPRLVARRGLGALMGGIAGATSTLIHAGGPPLNMYLATRQLPRAVWLSTAAVFFASVNLVKVFAYLAVDLWQLETLVLSAVLLPVAVAGILAGHRIQAVLSEAAFQRAVMVCLGLSGLLLIAKALA
ncbi:MAG: sulfite exporter TauE/SafE family protein [Algiphilus sp.]|nr:sulfite exporter TauE/SafE family protein [Algiphilus sp.]